MTRPPLALLEEALADFRMDHPHVESGALDRAEAALDALRVQSGAAIRAAAHIGRLADLVGAQARLVGGQLPDDLTAEQFAEGVAAEHWLSTLRPAELRALAATLTQDGRDGDVTGPPLEQVAQDIQAAQEQLDAGITYLRSTPQPDWQTVLAYLKTSRQSLATDAGALHVRAAARRLDVGWAGRVRLDWEDFSALSKVLFFALHGTHSSRARLQNFTQISDDQLEQLVRLCEDYEQRETLRQAAPVPRSEP